MKLFHNSRCSKSRATLELLKDQNVEVIDYLQNPPSVEELKSICEKLNVHPTDIIRVNEPEFKELMKNTPNPTDTQLLEWIHNTPKILERPIFVNGDRAVVGRPPANVLEII